MDVSFINYTGYQDLPFKAVISVLDATGGPFNLSGYTPSGCIFEQYGVQHPSSKMDLSIISGVSGKLQLFINSGDISELFPLENRYWLTLNSGDGPFVFQEGFFSLLPSPYSIISTGWLEQELV